MLTKKTILKALFSLLAVGLFIQPAFSQDMKDKDDESRFYVTEKGTEYELIGWEKDVVYNPYTYTWMEWTEPVYDKKKVKNVYPASADAFDRPPLFSRNCLNAEDKMKCTNSEMQEFVVDNDFQYPEKALDRFQEGQEYVSFKLTEDGIIKNIRVLAKEDICRGCSDVAADIVSSMKNMWFPAMKDGEPVATKITIPIKFKLKDAVDYNK